MSAVLTAYARALLPGAGLLRQLSIIEADGDECNIPNVGTADGPAHMVFYILHRCRQNRVKIKWEFLQLGFPEDFFALSMRLVYSLIHPQPIYP